MEVSGRVKIELNNDEDFPNDQRQVTGESGTQLDTFRSVDVKIEPEDCQSVMEQYDVPSSSNGVGESSNMFMFKVEKEEVETRSGLIKREQPDDSDSRSDTSDVGGSRKRVKSEQTNSATVKCNIEINNEQSNSNIYSISTSHQQERLEPTLTVERTTHATSAQVEALVEFLERNPSLARGIVSSQSARERHRRRRHWEELSLRLNSMGRTVKTYKQWTKYWSDKKNATKKKVAALVAARRNTDGGVPKDKELTELEERIVALLGGPGFANSGIRPDQGSVVPENLQSERASVTFPPPTQSSPLPSTSTHDNQHNLESHIPILSHPSALHEPQSTRISYPSHPLASIRSATSEAVSEASGGTNTRQVRARLGARSSTSRQRSPVTSQQETAPPQRRSYFNERFLRVEERQLKLQQSYARLLETLLGHVMARDRLYAQLHTTLGDNLIERAFERDRELAEGIRTVGEGLQAIAASIKRD